MVNKIRSSSLKDRLLMGFALSMLKIPATYTKVICLQLFHFILLTLWFIVIGLGKQRYKIMCYCTKRISAHKLINYCNLSVVYLCNDDMLIYRLDKDNLNENFKDRCMQHFKMEIPDWVLYPFSNINTARSSQIENSF